MMPQKKNPDVAELIRGKTGRVYGNLVALLTMMKGLPMTYNRDLQEDKEPLFDTADTVRGCLEILAEMVGHLKFNKDKMLKEASGGFTTATDMAEYLVLKGVPFREAHGVVGRLVAYCVEKKKDMAALTLKDFRRFHEIFDQDIYERFDVRNAVNSKKSIGGTSQENVVKRIESIKGNLNEKKS